MAAVVCALALPAVAHAETFISPDSGTVTINDNTVAAPYPSEVRVQGGDGPIVDINVFMVLTHDHPDDLDIALVSPEGRSTILTADNCLSTDLSGALFTFDQDAASPIPDNGPCGTIETFRPAQGTGGGATTWPGGPTPTSADLDTFVGEDPNGQWRLFVVDDSPGQTGSIPHWNMLITTEKAQIAVPAGPEFSGVADPYPSVVNAPAPDGQVITDLGVALPDFNHMHPDDVDMVVQAPGGETVMLMSDACGSDDMHDEDFRFDSVGELFSDNSSDVECKQRFLVRPSAFGEVEDLPAPAPPGPYGASLTAFNGLQGGDWRLWINDDAGSDTGWINNWSLVMKTRSAATTGFASAEVATAEGQTASLTVTRSGPVELGPATLDVTVNHNDTDPSDIGAVPNKLQFARGESSKTIEIPITPELVGEEAENFTVALSLPVDDALLADATSLATVRIARSDSDNRFTIGKAKRLRNGSARLEVTIPNPGTVTTLDAGPKELLKESTVDVERAGTVTVKVKPASKAKRKLRRGKKVKLTTEVIYTPYDGSANSAEAPVTLKKKP